MKSPDHGSELNRYVCMFSNLFFFCFENVFKYLRALLLENVTGSQEDHEKVYRARSKAKPSYCSSRFYDRAFT